MYLFSLYAYDYITAKPSIAVRDTVGDSDNIVMTREILISQLEALDLQVTPEGLITNGVVDYGTVGYVDLRPLKGPTISIPEVDHLEFDGMRGRVVVMMTDGSKRNLDGGFADRVAVKAQAQQISPQFAQFLAQTSGMQALTQLSGGMMKCPKTVSSLNAIFDQIYPDWESQMYYDELSEVQVIDMSMLDRPDLGERTVDDTVMAMYHENIELRLRAIGFDISRPPPTSVKDEILQIRMTVNSRNPFREWVESIEWDGEHRLDTIFARLFGATSVILEDDEDEIYLAAVARAWFLGAVARMYKPTQHDIVPVFVGGQGAGKTRALRYLAGKDEWYRSTSMEMSAKELQRFLDSVRGGIIVELGEATQLENPASAGLIKQFISQDSDHIRKAYARREQVFPRHFIMAATSNKGEVFTDPTGNRRFFPMTCRPERQTLIFSVDDRSVGGEEIEQVWAEALALFRAGERPNLTRNEQIIAEKVQDFYTREVTQANVIDEWLDDPANNLTSIGSKVSRSTIIEGVFGELAEDSQAMRVAEQSIIKWAEKTRSWARCKPFRNTSTVDRKVQRGWERVLAPGQNSAKITFAMVSSKDCQEEMDWAQEVVAFRRTVLRDGLKAGDLIPTKYSEETIARFLKAGFLTEVQMRNGSVRYVVGWIP